MCDVEEEKCWQLSSFGSVIPGGQLSNSIYVSLNIRTYVDHVKNICHLELANPLTKHILLVIW